MPNSARQTAYDVLGIGNAIVDILVTTDDAFLDSVGATKGTMSLVSAEHQRTLYNMVGAAQESSGGSAANTLAGVAMLGGRAAFVGKVKNDQLGDVFGHDIRAVGVDFGTRAAEDGPPTATCLVLITPDGQRTMQTALGACVELGPDDLDLDAIASSHVTYLEGYLWDPPAAREAFLAAARTAHDAGRQVSLSLSDPFCVDRHRDGFRAFVDGHIDVLFANEAEILSLYETESFDAAVKFIQGKVAVAALTRSEKGSVIVTPDEIIHVDATPVAEVVDTTGAGDAYAAGFLRAYTEGRPLADCARLGGVVAAEVIGRIGARPPSGILDIARRAGAA